MSAAAPNPENLIVLAAIGIGVYWFMTKRRVAAGTVPTQAVSNPYTGVANAANTVANVAGALRGLFGGGASSGSSWSPADTGANNPSAYVASSAVDGVAANIPGNSSVYDASAYGLDGSNGAFWN